MAEQTFTIGIVADPTGLRAGSKEAGAALQVLGDQADVMRDRIRRAYEAGGAAAQKASENLARSFDRPRDALGRFTTEGREFGERLARSFDRPREAIGRFTRQAREAEDAVDKVRRRGLELSDVFGRALTFAGVIAATKGVIGLADSFTQVQNRLRTVTEGEQQLASVTAQLLEVSTRTRASFQSTAELYSRIATNAAELGRSQSELLQFTESLNKAIILSGANAQEASAGLIQLSQGIASGTLRGDELRSVLEQLPAVADVIARQLGVTRGELRQMGTDGKITGDTILDAFAAARVELDERFAKTVPTVAQGFQQLTNETLAFVGSTDQAYQGTFRLANGLAFLSEKIKEARDFYSGFADDLRANEAEAALSGVGYQIQLATHELRNLESRQVISPAALARIEELRERLERLRGTAKEVTKAAEPPPKTESLAASKARLNAELEKEQALLKRLFGAQQQLVEGQAILKGAYDAGRISQAQYTEGLTLLAGKANQAADRMSPLAEALRDINDEIADLETQSAGPFGEVESRAQQRIREVDRRGGFTGFDDAQRKAAETEIRSREAHAEFAARVATLYRDAVSATHEYEVALAAANVVVAQHPHLVDEVNRKLIELKLTALDASMELGAGFERAFLRAQLAAQDYASVAESTVGVFADTAVDALTEFASEGEVQWKKLGQAAVAELTRIIAQLLVMQAVAAAGSALGYGAGTVTAPRAEGGMTQPGASYLIGERGPEIWRPNRTGTVIPNDQAFGQQSAAQVNVKVVNVKDPDEVATEINSGRVDQAIVNAVGRNASKVNAQLGRG